MVSATLLVATSLGTIARPVAAVNFHEPGYAFYRVNGFGLRAMGAALLWTLIPALVVVLLLAYAATSRPWVGPALAVGVVWSMFAAFSGVGPTAWNGLRSATLVLCGAAVVGLIWSAGRHTGRQSRIPSGAETGELATTAATGAAR